MTKTLSNIICLLQPPPPRPILLREQSYIDYNNTLTSNEFYAGRLERARKRANYLTNSKNHGNIHGKFNKRT